jgi:hypothetical protein
MVAFKEHRGYSFIVKFSEEGNLLSFVLSVRFAAAV